MVSCGISLIFLSDIFSSEFWSTSMPCTNHTVLELKDRMKQTALASRAPGTLKGYHRAFNRWKLFARDTLQIQPFPVSPFNLALYLHHLLGLTNSSSSINAAFYAVSWFHTLAGVESPTLHPAVIAINEGAVRLSAKEIHRKEPLETDHLRSLASQINFQDLLQLRNFVMFVLSFSGFMRASEVFELRRSDIKFESDHLSIKIAKSKNDQLREGKIVVIANSLGEMSPARLLSSYFSMAGISEDSKEYIFRPIHASKKQKQLVSVNKHISYTTYRESFKSSFKGIVPDIANYSTHSGRSGGATLAANSDVKERVFQRHGRWKTKKAKNMYVKDSLKAQLDVSKALSC